MPYIYCKFLSSGYLRDYLKIACVSVTGQFLNWRSNERTSTEIAASLKLLAEVQVNYRNIFQSGFEQRLAE